MNSEPIPEDLDARPNPDIDELAAVPELAPDVGAPPPDDALLDSAGTVFDPAVHATTRDGTPSYTKSGRFRKVRKPKGTAANDESPEDRRYRTAAEGTVAAIEMLATMVGGEAFAYIKDRKAGIDERASGIDAFSAWYESRGIEDFPPGIVVAIWAITYCAPRFAHQPVRDRFKKIGSKLGKGISRVFKGLRKISGKK